MDDADRRRRWPGWLAALTVSLTIVAFDPAGWFAFAPVKWLVVTAGGMATFAAGLWSGTLTRPSRTVGALLCVWLGWLAVCAAFGADPRYAWLGTPERHAGWLMWLLCAGLFVSGVPWSSVADGLVAAGVVLVPVLVADAFGHPVIASGTERLTATLGSAAYLGAACALILPVAVASALDGAGTRRRRRVAAVAALSAMFGLVGSGTRGAWVAMVVVGGVFVWRRRWDRRTWGVVAAAALIVVLAAATTPVFDRGSTALDTGVAGGVSRLDEWRVGLHALNAHPVAGVGPEGYRIDFADGVDRAYERAHGRYPLPDRAHDVVLDMALIGGIPGAAVYVALLGAIGVAIRRRRWSGPALGAVAALAMYLLQQLFLFPLAELEPVVFLLAGSLACPTSNELRPRRPVAVLVAVVAVGALVAGGLDVVADRTARDAIRAAARGDMLAARSAARRAVSLRPDEVRLRLLQASVAATPQLALPAIDAALRWSPDPVAVVRRAEALSTTDPARAVTEISVLVERDRLNGQLQLLLGNAAVRAGDTDLAERAWLRAFDLAPLSEAPRRNLIALYLQQGRVAEAGRLEAGGNP